MKIANLIAAAAVVLGFATMVASTAQAQYTNGYYHGPRDGQCYNNKRGC